MPQWHRNLPEALWREESQHSSPNTLPKLLSSPSPSATLPRSYDSVLKEVNPPSAHLLHTYSHSPLTRLNLSQLLLLSPLPHSQQILQDAAASLLHSFSPCPIGLRNHTSLQKEKSRNKPTNGVSVNCLLYCRNKLTSVRKHFYLLIIAARSLLLKD